MANVAIVSVVVFLVVVRENFGKVTTLMASVFFAMATLESLELGLVVGWLVGTFPSQSEYWGYQGPAG